MNIWKHYLECFFFNKEEVKKTYINFLYEKLRVFLIHEHASNICLKKIDKDEIVIKYQVLSSEYLQILPTNVSYINNEGNFIYEESIALDKNLNTGKESLRRQSYLKLAKPASYLFKEIETKMKLLAKT